MPPGRERVTLQQVAAELGVSAKTVSNAYRRPDQLSARLREEILATAERLGYGGPDPLAAALRRGRVGAIGFAYDNRLSYAFEDPVSVQLLAGITAVAEPAGAGLLLLAGGAGDRGRVLGEAVVDGLVVNSLADDDPLLNAAIARNLPLVVVDQPEPGRLAELGASGTPWVGIDDVAAAARLADHVLELGHRHLAVVCFGLYRQPRPGLIDQRRQLAAAYGVSRGRIAGFRDAARRAGVDWRRVPVVEGTDSTVADGEAGALAVLSVQPRPTALLCLSDRLAEGALNVAARLGLDVPRELSITGFDDAPHAADLGLTTVRQPTRRKGELAARLLLDRLDRASDGTVTTLPTELVVRRTTGSPPNPSATT